MTKNKAKPLKGAKVVMGVEHANHYTYSKSVVLRAENLGPGSAIFLASFTKRLRYVKELKVGDWVRSSKNYKAGGG